MQVGDSNMNVMVCIFAKELVEGGAVYSRLENRQFFSPVYVLNGLKVLYFVYKLMQ